MQAAPIETVVGNVVAPVAAGMGAAFLVADWRSTTSRVLAAFLMCMGVTIWANSGFQLRRDLDSLPLGVVGGARLEYVAVGSTVNLAARLCQIAPGGQILLDRRTRELLGDDRRFTEETRVTLKGFSEPMPVYVFA